MEALTQAEGQVTDLLSRPMWALDDDELVEVVEGSTVLASRLTAAAALATQELGRRNWARRHNEAGLATWLRSRVRMSIYAARRLCALGELLTKRSALCDAVTSGAVTTHQATSIGTVLADMPADVDAATLEACETRLIEFAAEFDPSALATLGQRALAHVAPDVADDALAKKLARDDERAAQSRSLAITPDGMGRVRIRGLLPVEDGAVITAVLDPLTKPTESTDGGRDPRTAAQRRADAFGDVFRLVLGGVDLPRQGGERPQLNVTVDFDVLNQKLGSGTLDTGHPLSAQSIRRLACDAAILPVVLGREGVVLDVGRSRRLFTGSLRRAVVLRDRGCAFPGCDRKPRWCEVHHIISWADGGLTCLANAVLLCRFHHHVIHEPGGWEIRMGVDGRPDFIPPQYLDPLRDPRRNTIHAVV